MDRETELAIIRRAYAKQILAAVGVRDARIEAAYATVRREDFLGPGPWQFFRWVNAYIRPPDADPVYLYTDDVIAIAPERDQQRANRLCTRRSLRKPCHERATTSSM
jgi:protein-L-isoaspartate(D-aspartate) O-methyltransferase